VRQLCEKCSRSYDDEYCSTLCPHRGIGFCAVCDCTICVCTEKTSSDWERSTANRKGTGASDGMTRTEKIIQHLKAKGAQYVPVFDRHIGPHYTEHVFRGLTKSVRLREWRSNGSIEILFVCDELCAGAAHDDWNKTPEMDWILKTIDEETQLQPQPEAKIRWPAKS